MKISSVPPPRVTKPNPPHAVEPFDDDNLKTARRGHVRMGAGGVFARMRRLRLHRENFQNLHSLGAPDRFAHDTRARLRRLETVLAQGRHMQKHVRTAIVWRNEAKSLDDVKPFDLARRFNDFMGPRLAAGKRRVRLGTAARPTVISRGRFFVQGDTSAKAVPDGPVAGGPVFERRGLARRISGARAACPSG